MVQERSPLFKALGLGEAAEIVYEALLDRPATMSELAAGTMMSIHRLTHTLETLAARGLISTLAGPPARYAATDPETALEVLLLEREQQIQQARTRVHELGARFRRASAGTNPAELVEIVTGRDAIIGRMDQLQHAARSRMRILDKPPYHGDPMEPEAGELDLLRRGGSVRVIYDQDGLAIPGRMRHLDRAIAAGEQARTLAELPAKLAIIDEKYAVVPLHVTDASPSPSFVIIHESGLLNALAGLFTTLWQLALPLAPGAAVPGSGARAPAPAGPTEDEQRILALLTIGLPDDSVARHLGMSPRTYQRRVHDMMERLHVQTRFQLARQATRHGWLELACSPRRWSNARSGHRVSRSGRRPGRGAAELCRSRSRRLRPGRR